MEQEHRFKNHESWKAALQEAPNDKWIKTRDIGSGKKSSYLPLGIQEALADYFFREFDIIETDVQIAENQVVSQVKISILADYPNAEHRIISGIAAKTITKAKNSLEYVARSSKNSAKSEALTDFANIFGRNLNRDFKNNFSYGNKNNKPEEK